jgi:hypothetical protein
VNSIYNRRYRGPELHRSFSARPLSGPQIAFPVLAHTVSMFSGITAERSRSVSDRARRQEYDLLHSKTRLTRAAVRF